ncbi:thiol-disulfide oxidoreductase DCC family protein [Zunongwangia sp.]|uniref:thiol-disulfide oxidoreductase DCC family protein n=1 Tax=Zunongwangia sp. TaxID=1965325 RepID=UPI003AA954F5
MPNKYIVLFDGVCNLCDNTVQFIIKRDKKDLFRFASLQSDVGKSLLKERGINPNLLNTIILIIPGKAWYQKSDAALRIAKKLSGGYFLLSWFLVLPKSIRDLGYDIVSKNRYKWFGKKNRCMIPTPEIKKKFIS